MNAMTASNATTVTDEEAITNDDVTEAVRSTALLADVSLSLWGAERTDKKIMDTAKANAGAVGNVGRAIKNLLSGADNELREVRSTFSAVRATHYELTLPWVSDPHAVRASGPRLLANLLWDKYIQAVSLKRRAALAALDAFLLVYPARCAEARANLAGLADESDYPTVEQVRSKFRISIDFEPIPSGSSFRGLPDVTMTKLEGQLRKKQQLMLDGASKAMWSEVRERVGNLLDRTSVADVKMKGATVANVAELAQLLPGWNVGGDPRVAEIVGDIDRMVVGVSVQALHTDAGKRATVAAQAQAVTDKLAAWGL